MTEWKEIGKLSTGESVYRDKNGGYAVEKDRRHLVEPTPGELAEIRLLELIEIADRIIQNCNEMKKTLEGISHDWQKRSSSIGASRGCC